MDNYEIWEIDSHLSNKKKIDDAKRWTSSLLKKTQNYVQITSHYVGGTISQVDIVGVKQI
jgi:hypothetical protein